MAEKGNFENNQVKKERFEFVLTVNDNIVCQRYFWISGFKERSLGSVQLNDAIERCVELINKDLKEKTNIYNWYTAPQVFANREEMEKCLNDATYEDMNVKFNLEVPSYVILTDTDEVCIWNGSSLEPYNKPFNKADYVKQDSEESPCILKFAFLDDGKEVAYQIWDVDCPKFVRSNIDLANKINKYAAPNVYAPMEEFLMDKFVKSQKDLIPEIVRTICTACSGEASEYYHYVDYGNKKYAVNVQKANADYENKVEASCRKRTNAYFKSL